MGLESYGGSAIFGLAVRMKTDVNPSADQLNSFFGVNGMESLFGGTRGRVTLVEGLLFGDTAYDLRQAEETFVTYNDGIARTLVDTAGYSFDYVKFQAFEPVSERIIYDGRSYWRQYRASFRHLT